MWLQTLIVLTCASSFEFRQLSRHCTDERTLYILKRSTYDFSVKLLDRVLQDAEGHFVFSPLSTWVQLTALAEGARGQTFREIWAVTRHHRRSCMKLKWKKIVNVMETELRPELKLSSAMIIDKLLSVKHSFLEEIGLLNNLEVLLYNFNSDLRAAAQVNEFIKKATAGKISDILFAQDFNMTTLLTVDVMHYKSAWKYNFNPSYTKRKPFYSEMGVEIGEVNMMKQLGYFNMTEIPVLKSKVLELPCGKDGRISMLIFLPNKDDTIWNLFYYMRRVKIMSIFQSFSHKSQNKLVSVELPRFNISTDLDNIPELIYDMGVKRMFSPQTAQFEGMTDFSVYASLMTQVARIEVTEEGVVADSVVENLILDGKAAKFVVNKPFVFMLVDRTLELILFAGAYMTPSVV